MNLFASRNLSLFFPWFLFDLLYGISTNQIKYIRDFWWEFHLGWRKQKEHTLPDTNMSPLKTGHPQKEMNNLPTIDFQGLFSLLVSRSRVYEDLTSHPATACFSSSPEFGHLWSPSKERQSKRATGRSEGGMGWWVEMRVAITLARCWFQTFFIFTPTWGNDPIWLIFFKWVETTN